MGRAAGRDAGPDPAVWELYLASPPRDLLAQVRQYQPAVAAHPLGVPHADSPGPPVCSWDLLLQTWPPIAAAALASAFLLPAAARQHRRLRRRRSGRCVCCAYDLRGTSERCPECGAVPAPGQSADRPAGA